MSFTEEQTAFRDTVRKMVAKHVAPIAAEIDETDRFPLELVKLFGEMGLMQLCVPERYGGPNGNLTMACLAREEISRVSPACASIAALNTMFIMPLLHFGSEEQRKKFLPIIAKGGVVTAIAISEPQAGSDVTAISTRAKKDGAEAPGRAPHQHAHLRPLTPPGVRGVQNAERFAPFRSAARRLCAGSAAPRRPASGRPPRPLGRRS